MVLWCAAADTEPAAVAAGTVVHTDGEWEVVVDIAVHTPAATDGKRVFDAHNEAAAAAGHKDADCMWDVAVVAMMMMAVGVTPSDEVVPVEASPAACRQVAVYHTADPGGQCKEPAAKHTGLTWEWHSEARRTTETAAALVDELAQTLVQLAAELKATDHLHT